MMNIYDIIFYKTMTGWRFIDPDSLDQKTLVDIESVGKSERNPIVILDVVEDIVLEIQRLHDGGRGPRHGDYYSVKISDSGATPSVAHLCRACGKLAYSIEIQEDHYRFHP